MCSDYPHELEELLPQEAFRKRVKARVEERIARARAEVAAGRRKFSGVKSAMKLSVWHSERSPQSGETGRRAKPRRRVAAATEGRLKAMLEGLLAFRKAHRIAWEALSRGLRDVVFPAGTWFAWRFYGAERVPEVNRAFEAPS